jgi:dephospho-CoA kinase
MKKLRIGVVGPCAAGKTTLVAALKNRGYEVHHIAQEHSYVP